MHLEDYFDFQSPDDIRIRGHRIGIETVLDAHLRAGLTAEEIQATWPSLSLEEVYATLLYYHRNRPALDCYLQAWADCCDQSAEDCRQDQSPLAQRLRAIRAELDCCTEDQREPARRAIVDRHRRRAEVEQSQRETRLQAA